MTGRPLRVRRSVSIRYTGPRDRGHRAHARLESTLRASGLRIEPSEEPGPDTTAFHIGIEDDRDTAHEGYRLQISSAGVQIYASDPAGLFYGVITFGQLLDQALGEGSGGDSAPLAGFP